MEQGFPVAGADISPTMALLRYTFLAALAVSIVIGVIATISRPATRREAIFWIGGIGVFPGVAVLLSFAWLFIGWPGITPEASGMLVAFGLYCCAYCAYSFWVMSPKITGQEQARFALNALTVLVFLLLGVTLILPAMSDGSYARRLFC